MLTVELKVDGKSIGMMEIIRTACDDNQAMYQAMAFEQKLTGHQESVRVDNVDHWRPDGAWRLVEKSIKAFCGRLPKTYHGE